MQASGLSQVVVLIMGVLLLCQAALVFLLFTSASKGLRKMTDRSASLVRQAQAATASLRQLLAHTDGLYERLSALETRGPNLAKQVLDWVQTSDRAIEQGLQRAREALLQFDSMADLALTGFSRQTFRVHRAIVHPALRFSELLHTGASLVGKLASKDKSPASFSSEEEIFI